METELDRRIAELRRKFKTAEDSRTIDDIEKRLRTTMARSGLKERPEIKEIIHTTQARIEEINFLLAHDKTLNEPTEAAARQRTRLFDERNIHQFWLERLDGSLANQSLKNLENVINNLLTQ